MGPTKSSSLCKRNTDRQRRCIGAIRQDKMGRELTSEKTDADGDGGEVLDAIGSKGALLEDVALADKVLVALGNTCTNQQSLEFRVEIKSYERLGFRTVHNRIV